MELTIRGLLGGTLTTRRAADIAERMKKFESRVLLCRQNITVNAKSLMGLVTLGLHRKQALSQHFKQLESIWETYEVYLEEEGHGDVRS